MNEDFGPTLENLGNDSLSHPIQGFHMSVKEYYNQFRIWISKLETVNSVHYVDDDEWYVVDFIYGLKMDLMMRVLRHKGIHRVSDDAFRKAEIEEILISWEENYGLNKADGMFEVMPQPKSVHSDEIHKADDVDDDKSDDLVGQIEIDPEIIVSPIASCKVFDDCSHPAFIAASGSNSMLRQCISFPVIVVADLRLHDMVNLLVPKARDEVPNNKCLMNPFYVKNENAIVLFENVVMYYIDPGGSGSQQSFCMVANKVENKFVVVEEQTSYMKMGCSKIGTSVDLQEDVYGGAMSRHKYELLLLSRVRAKNIDELTSAEVQLCATDPCSRGSSLHHEYATKHSLEARKEKHGYGAISSALHECALPENSLKLLELRRKTSGYLLFDAMPELIIVEHTHDK